MEIDPRKLIYFASIVEQGSLNRAARAMNISQPAMTASMDRLEKELGVKLLERGPQGIVLTAKGEALYCHARLIREEVELARRDMEDAGAEGANMIRIGALPSLAGGVMPQALSHWQEEYPDTKLQVVEHAQFDLLTNLIRRELDLVIGYTKVFDMLEGLRQQVLFRDVLCVLVRPEHPLSDGRRLGWNDLVSYPWIAPTARMSHTVLEQIFNTLGIGPPARLTVCGTVSLVRSMLAQSDHVAVLPQHAVQRDLAAGRLVKLPFEDPVLHRNIAVFFREGYEMDQERRKLVDCIRRAGLELSREPQEDDEVPN